MILSKCLWLLTLLTTISVGTCCGQNLKLIKSTDYIVRTANENHLRPRAMDDSFSSLVYDQIMESLDPYSMIFSSEDAALLDSKKQTIDDDINAKRLDFISELNQVYTAQLNSLGALVTEFKNERLNLTIADSIEFDSDHGYLSEQAKTKHWHKWLKLKILLELFGNPDSLIADVSFSNDEIRMAKTIVLEREECHLNFLSTSTENKINKKVGDAYIRAVASAFDPHTIYFSASDEQQFSSLISNATMSFGFDIGSNESAEIEIISILPGSPAWNSGLINEGDVITSILSAAKANLDLTCISASTANEYLSDPDLDYATFRIKKKSGKQLNVELKKELAEIKENAIQSFVLDGEHSVGYIYLPTFYTTEDNGGFLPNGCANDIGKELIRLERENTEALIIDLRNNGGGSMLEALRLVGLFIDFGPIGISLEKGQPPVTLKDMDRGILSNKPLVVLTNEFSASASELFSACIQDYNRGLIVGSRTFGKSTIQRVLPLNTNENQKEFLKLTIGEFFRITGDQLQQVGVFPDIGLPSYINWSESTEKAYPSSLSSEKIDKKTYYRPLQKLPLEELKTKSEARVRLDSMFAKVSAYTESKEVEFVPLTIKGFQNLFNGKMREYSDDDKFERPSSPFTITVPSFRNASSDLADNTAEDSDNQQYMEQDIYLQETFRITIDLINTLKKQ
ncbi:MAG: carboxy terminal-processing peptidase [Flavobacteriales bacterium]|nr:carboxy terminal-processing peptidase [Flavobacteriales bacterium]